MKPTLVRFDKSYEDGSGTKYTVTLNTMPSGRNVLELTDSSEKIIIDEEDVGWFLEVFQSVKKDILTP